MNIANKSPHPMEIAIAALKANPAVFVPENYFSALSDPEFDITFDELEIDSVARMELSIWLELEYKIEITEGELQSIGSVRRLARMLEIRLV